MDDTKYHKIFEPYIKVFCIKKDENKAGQF